MRFCIAFSIFCATTFCFGVTGSIRITTGSFSGSVVDNVTDVYTTTPAIEHVISLTQAQYNAISASADPNTLYYITDAPSFVVSASYAANVGLVRGSSPNSMRNANILVTTPATASGTGSIALGNNARSFADYSVIIGDSAQNYDSARPNSIFIGRNASGAQNSIGIGWGAAVLSDSSVGIEAPLS